MGEVVDRHHHLPAVKERHIAMRNVQNVGFLLAQLAVGELELFLVAVDAALEGYMRRNISVRFQFFLITEGYAVAYVTQPMLDTGTDSGAVHHAGVYGDFREITHRGS